jgi:hypothetical protein
LQIYAWFCGIMQQGKTVNIFEDVNIRIFFHYSNTNPRTLILHIHICVKVVVVLSSRTKRVWQKLNTQLISNTIILLSNFVSAILYLMFWTRSYFYVLLIVRNFFAFIFNVLACFAQFSQIEQRNILLTFSRNDGKSRQEITIFIQYLGYNLGYLN